jgi:hypothetical protein
MSESQQLVPLPQEPLLIYASRELDGYTYQLDPGSFGRVRQQLGEPKRQFPRIFISYDVKDDLENLAVLVGGVERELVLLLTGLSEDAIRQLGGVEFRNPDTDQPFFSWLRS